MAKVILKMQHFFDLILSNITFYLSDNFMNNFMNIIKHNILQKQVSYLLQIYIIIFNELFAVTKNYNNALSTLFTLILILNKL